MKKTENDCGNELKDYGNEFAINVVLACVSILGVGAVGYLRNGFTGAIIGIALLMSFYTLIAVLGIFFELAFIAHRMKSR